MSDYSPHLELPFILPGQAQKHVIINEAFERLDITAQLVVQDFAAASPPETPVEGQSYIIGAAPSGVWSEYDDKIAGFYNGGWVIVTPRDGWIASTPAGDVRVRQNGKWQAVGQVAEDAFQNLNGLGINGQSDAWNVLALSGPGSLFNHAGNGHQIKLNKAHDYDTASVMFQTNWSGRAEFGLTGSDEFSIKTSADGSTWATPFQVTANTVTINNVLAIKPGTAPQNPAAGMIYFDAALNKLRCFDGAAWKNLY